MEKIITYETLRSFTYSNDKICRQPIKGVILSFFGLNGRDMYSEDLPDAVTCAQNGILYLVPYNNPWAWMNRQAIDYTDEILDVLFAHYGLDDSLPVVSTGGSMGGQSAQIYTYYAKRTPVACVANCPVCDMVFHFTERPDLPRTIYSAYFNEQGDLNSVLERFSPLHLADKMPKVKYHYFHCTADQAVNMQNHTDKMVAKLRQNGYDVTYDIVPDRGHCDIGDEMKKKFLNYAVQAVLEAQK